MWRETTKYQRNKRIWQEELDGFLPGKILDFHVHVINADAIPPGEKFFADDMSESHLGMDFAPSCGMQVSMDMPAAGKHVGAKSKAIITSVLEGKATKRYSVRMGKPPVPPGDVTPTMAESYSMPRIQAVSQLPRAFISLLFTL